MNKLGFYIEVTTGVPGLADAIREILPPTLLTHANDRGLLQAMRRDLSPDTFVIGRLHFDPHQQNEWLAGDGERAGRGEWLDCQAAQANGRRLAEVVLAHDFGMAKERYPNEPGGRLLIDAWMSLNECIAGPMSDDWVKGSEEERQKLKAKATAFDCFQVGFHERLQQEGLEAVAFNFGAGNFQKPEHYLDWFPRTLDTYTYLGFHEYGWPTLYPDDSRGTESAAYLYHACLERFKQTHPGREYKVIITEAGMARMYHKQKVADGDVGWLFEGETLSQEDYWSSLAWYNDKLSQDDYVLGACLFNVGPTWKWVTFRHLGMDNAGQPIRITDKIKDLAVPRAAARARGPTAVTLQGQVNHDGRAVRGAKVRIIGSPHTLGADPRASSYEPGAATWTRAITGFEGNAWNAWQKYVVKEVAGITWAEFRAEVGQYNPSLAETDGQFEAERTYYVPEIRTFEDTRSARPEVVWDRQVSGFSGSRWDVWRTYVRTKVAGLDWDTFRREVLANNPQMAEDGNRFVPGKSYLLPRNAGQYDYTRVEYTNSQGRYRLTDLKAGRYEIEVSAPGYQLLRRDVKIGADMTLDLELESVVSVRTRGAQFMRTEGDEFRLGERTFEFVGVNMTGLAHYGTDQFKHTEREQKEERRQLHEARQMGARVVRLFLPHEEVSIEETANRLGRLLELIKNEFINMYLIVSFTDLYSDTPFHPPGDRVEFLTVESGGKVILSPAWFEGGYNKNYLPLVKHVVGRFKDEPNIFAWEVGNELKVDNRPELFVSFNLAVADAIWNLDQRHLITTGIISTRHAYMQHRPALRSRLYDDVSKMGFLTNHAYNGQNDEDDSQLARDVVKKPFIIEEAGFDLSQGEDRAALVAVDLDKWFRREARGYMQWGFMAGDRDIGDGDSTFGIDRRFHRDWDSLTNVFRQRASQFRIE